MKDFQMYQENILQNTYSNCDKLKQLAQQRMNILHQNLKRIKQLELYSSLILEQQKMLLQVVGNSIDPNTLDQMQNQCVNLVRQYHLLQQQ